MKRILSLLLCMILITGMQVTPAFAALEWPSNVSVEAEGAVLMDARSGAVIYGKNLHAVYYPASITKILTALIVIEHCNLDDVVTFSHDAIYSVEQGSSSAGMEVGDQMTVRDCLYAMLLKSANEVANALAEHTAGSIQNFAVLMNAKARELGCQESHFNNPSGLNDPQHYTSAYDMALIAQAAFQNETFVTIDSSLYYDLPPTRHNPDGFRVYPGHRMLKKNTPQYYAGVIGGKTGYTSLAGNTLVTCAERNGVRLIAVILKSSQTHYDDTKKLLDYGFAVAGSASGTPAGTNTSVSDAANNSTSNSSKPSGNTTSTNTSSSGSQGGPGSSGAGNTAAQGDGAWQQFGNEWKYLKANGTYAANESLLIKGETYYFHADAWMARDWQMVNGSWHYYTESGAMAKSRWIQTNGYWYYVSADGALFVNGTTPDGYRVDANGVWIQK